MNPAAPGPRIYAIKSERDATRLFPEICRRINAAASLSEVLDEVKEDIRLHFRAERIAIFIYDGRKRELVSRWKSGDEIPEIRIPVTTSSIAGSSVVLSRALNIRNVYNQDELSLIDPGLKFDSRWDRKTGFTTQEVLVVPILFKKFTFGAIELINRMGGGPFQDSEVMLLRELARIIGIALYNQKKTHRNKPDRYDYLLENHMLTPKELEKAFMDARRQGRAMEEILIGDLGIPKEAVGKSLSNFFEVPFIEYRPEMTLPSELAAGLKPAFLRNNLWAPVGREEGGVVIAIDNPYNLQKVDEIRVLFPGRKVLLQVALAADIHRMIDRLVEGKEAVELKEMPDAPPDPAEKRKEPGARPAEGPKAAGHAAPGAAPPSEEPVLEGMSAEEDSAIIRLVNTIIFDSFARGASDIHIEPFANRQDSRVRIRVDGGCVNLSSFPADCQSAVVSRIKIMSGLDIAERRKPQDGKIKIKIPDSRDLELRVATVPTQGGLETVALRILADSEPIRLENLGFSKRNHDHFLAAVTKPYGIILVCGPTGSGKTTTLHSALGHINKPDLKIWTAEDPVEITQQGLSQVQVQPRIGFDFAAAMRAFLRADPDVIMVGEMRDAETAKIGIEASLTGHLVFSTLHTNNAPESITRLLNMGIEPFNFADAVLCILAQRLVPTLCRSCKQAYHPGRDQYDELVREYGAEAFRANGLWDYSDDLTLYRANGCKTCGFTGYRGRMGIHELLVNTPDIKRLIETRAKVEAIREQALKDGMTTLKQDGIEKIFHGDSDLFKVRKVCID